ncbi:hypothetical protein E2C01_081614 [Portunus trituberculatus]|uniref:Uncharacterized protein n=1 Tax=Portunus trituberculatus TaxID=210409 RepID=A0A5B7J1L7_PORTR|nr:hypothetical protein [Portunus trituberculatus]
MAALMAQHLISGKDKRKRVKSDSPSDRLPAAQGPTRGPLEFKVDSSCDKGGQTPPPFYPSHQPPPAPPPPRSYTDATPWLPFPEPLLFRTQRELKMFRNSLKNDCRFRQNQLRVL